MLKDIKDRLSRQLENYKSIYNEYLEHKENIAFAKKMLEGPDLNDAMAQNNILNTRLLMFNLAFSPGPEVSTQEEYERTPYYITLMNIYTLMNALHAKNSSFILPVPMLERLLELKSLFRNEDEALDFLESFETSRSRAR